MQIDEPGFVKRLRYSSNGKFLLAQLDDRYRSSVWSTKTKREQKFSAQLFHVSCDGSVLYLECCPTCESCHLTWANKKSVGIGRRHCLLGKDLIATITKSVARVFNGGRQVGITNGVDGGTRITKKDASSCYLFQPCLMGGGVGVSLWNFKSDDHTDIMVIDDLRNQNICSSGDWLFILERQLVRVFDLAAKKEIQGIHCWCDFIDADIEADSTGQYLFVSTPKICFHVLDVVLRQEVLMDEVETGYVFAVAPDFTHVAMAKATEEAKEIQIARLVPIFDIVLGLCCSDLPPYVILLICDWFFVLSKKCTIEAAERWHHAKKIKLIASLPKRAREKRQ